MRSARAALAGVGLGLALGSTVPAAASAESADRGQGRATQELADRFRPWNRPIEPFQIAANLYYVGTNELAVYLFTTPAGHILLDGGFEQTAPLVRDSVEKLGFALTDVEIILNSHAHSDHAGGLAMLAAASGAEVVASRGDAPLLAAGGEDPYPFPPVEPDREIEDGATIELGGTVLTARVTAGHTPGCTTWTSAIEVDGAARAAVFICSLNALPEMDLLTADPAYPGGRVAAFERSFDLLDEIPCELFLGAHGSFFHLDAKREARARGGAKTTRRAPLPRLCREARARGGANPFVDPELCRRHVAAKRERFEAELARQRERR